MACLEKMLNTQQVILVFAAALSCRVCTTTTGECTSIQQRSLLNKYMASRKSGEIFQLGKLISSLQALVPVTIEVEVPFDLHRYIIGQKGSGIRKMMDEFEVSCCFSS